MTTHEVMQEKLELTRFRLQSPGKLARISPLRTLRFHHPGPTRSASRFTTLVSAIPVCLASPVFQTSLEDDNSIHRSVD